MNIVTGASGFIGFCVVQQLLQRGESVRCLVRNQSRTETLDALPVEVRRVDFNDSAALSDAVQGCERFFHVAGCVASLTEKEMFAVNCSLTERLAEACSRLENPPTFLYVSSLAAAGAEYQPGALREEWMPPVPVSVYGRSKLQAERLLRKQAGTLPISVVRPPIVLGPGDIHGLPLFQGIKKSGIHLCPGWKKKLFSVVMGDDVAQTLILAADKGKRLVNVDQEEYLLDSPTEQGIYNVSRNVHLEYGELGRAIGRAVGRNRIFVKYAALPVFWTVCAGAELIIRLTKKPLILNLDKYREAAAGNWTTSMKKVEKELGFQPNGDFEQLLVETAEDYKRRGWI